MMIMADGGSGLWPGREIEGVDDPDGCDGGEDLALDVDMILSILESEDPSQGSPDDLKVESTTDLDNEKNFQLHSGFQMPDGEYALESEPVDPAMVYPSHNLEDLDTKICGSVESLDCAGSSAMALDDVKLKPSSQIGSTMHTGSLKGWSLPLCRNHGTERVGVLQSGITSCSNASSFAEGASNCFPDNTGDLYTSSLLGETGAQLGQDRDRNDVRDASQDLYMENPDGKFDKRGSVIENSLRIPGPENDCYKSIDMPFWGGDISLHDYGIVTTQSPFGHNSDVNAVSCGHYSDAQFGHNSDDAYSFDSLSCYLGGDFNIQLCSRNEVITTNHKDEIGEFQTESACSVSEISMIDHCDAAQLNYNNEASNSMSPVSGNFSSNADDRIADNNSSRIPLSCSQSAISKRQLAAIEDGKSGEVVACRSMMYHSDGMTYEAANGKVSCTDESGLGEEDSRQSFSGLSSRVLSNNPSLHIKNDRGHKNFASVRAQPLGNACKAVFDGSHMNLNVSDQYGSYVTEQRFSNMIQPKCLGHISSISRESIQSNLSGSCSRVDDDSDVCILEDISQAACSNQSLAHGKSNAPLQHCAYGDSMHYGGVASTRFRANDERFIFQAALQDLSQPKSEASPPEGVLAVPLLRHQRIALSWMIQKETSSIYCSGGILADDQGLGKTVSTIALILKERPALVKSDLHVVKKEEFETLDLDEEDELSVVDRVKNAADSCQVKSHKGRPAAGTLVVCPTSVLRQWADELQKKVTSKANLSVLVYHGSNRTKDPFEVAKYDVVLTTYSIVSMEVPKQPLVDEDDDEKVKAEGDDVASLGLSSGKKRKYPPSSGKKGAKNKKNMDAALLESVARPLAKVAWFRVVLDEAQSIKNHRTQVARACWGLRAKRRWCLSGTPIQNAIDDLYSYFRFLRYDPYAVYNSFCSTIKNPIQRSPAKGYKKLQAVLKTIMLRRTKGTHIDGKPIVTLPPKVVELKKVDFTDEERDFYTRLEADSRDQFREYAAAGTVKQNYVNILLMLLRLRQACDHPCLVRGMDSNPLGRSSIEIAKKLSRERQADLLNCLEASLAICGICNDPPEDAVVSICGHVFCNQCICEHLTGDDTQCPTSKCKVRLNTCSVFSKATLNSLLSDQPMQDGSGCELGGAVNLYSEGLPYNSSKIRAALEVLQSLTKPQDCTAISGSLGSSHDGNSTICPENSCNSGNSPNDATDRKNLFVHENVNDSVKVVGEKAIVFSQWTRMLDLLEACLKNSSIQYRRLDGTMSVLARDKAVKDFNTNPEVSVMIMSLKAASLGLNMVAACRVLLLDLWWNPTTEDQAIDRAHRIGQTRPVTVLRLTVKDTVEDRILALQEKKREMVASAFGEDETGGRQTRLTVEDLNYLFMV